MSKYLLAFHGGKMPDNPEAMQASGINRFCLLVIITSELA